MPRTKKSSPPPMPALSSAVRRARTIVLIKRLPGLDAVQLAAAGWDVRTHESLKTLELAGLIEWRDGGWFLKQGDEQ